MPGACWKLVVTRSLVCWIPERIGHHAESCLDTRPPRAHTGAMATPDPALRITYAGREATTIALAAAELGHSARHMSTTLTRLGVHPLPRADGAGRAEID